jgi:hypothetical protein
MMHIALPAHRGAARTSTIASVMLQTRALARERSRRDAVIPLREPPQTAQLAAPEAPLKHSNHGAGTIGPAPSDPTRRTNQCRQSA